MGFWDAVASARPYANNLHLAPPTARHSNFTAGCSLWHLTNSVRAPKASEEASYWTQYQQYHCPMSPHRYNGSPVSIKKLEKSTPEPKEIQRKLNRGRFCRRTFGDVSFVYDLSSTLARLFHLQCDAHSLLGLAETLAFTVTHPRHDLWRNRPSAHSDIKRSSTLDRRTDTANSHKFWWWVTHTHARTHV